MTRDPTRDAVSGIVRAALGLPLPQEPVSTAPSPSYLLKFERSKVHLRDLHAAFETWCAGSYRVLEETDDEGITTVSLQLLSPPPEHLSVLIGDVAQGLYNVLDHLAFALALKHTPALSEAEERDSAWPFQIKISSQSAVPPKVDRRVRAVHPDAQAEIMRMQPSQDGAAADRHPIALLHDLANRDKHRLVQAVAAAASRRGAMGKLGTTLSYFRLFKTHAVMGTEPVPIYAFRAGEKENVEVGMAIDLDFGPGPLVAGRSVLDTLHQLTEHIESVIARLAPWL